jgi:hypothetical protein
MGVFAITDYSSPDEHAARPSSLSTIRATRSPMAVLFTCSRFDRNWASVLKDATHAIVSVEFDHGESYSYYTLPSQVLLNLKPHSAKHLLINLPRAAYPYHHGPFPLQSHFHTCAE